MLNAKGSPVASQGTVKGRGKRSKGGKAKVDIQEEMDPRKLELLNWVKMMGYTILYYTISFIVFLW